MGNSSSSSSRSHDETVDFGFLTPQGVYTGPRDWNQAVVTQLICARRLAPFYRPLEDYDDSWTDDQILAARKELPDSKGGPESASRSEPLSASSISSKSSSHSKRPNTLKEPSKPEAAVYRGATECPICFLVSILQKISSSSLLILRHSIIPSISIILGAVTKPYVQNALCKSSAASLRLPI